jgi:hypothetical protein
MTTTSEDIQVRCKSCGVQIAGASATVRAETNAPGVRILQQAKWILGRLQCGDCAARDGKR